MRTAAAALMKIAEEGTTKRGVVMPRDERRKLCDRLLAYAKTITNVMCKTKALARVQKVITELDRAQLQQNNANEAELIATNLHTVDTTIGQLENMRDRMSVQNVLNRASEATLNSTQSAKLLDHIQELLPNNETDIPHDSVAPEALDADGRAAEWAKTARSSSDPPPEADQINEMLEEEAEKRQQRQSRKRKTFMMDMLLPESSSDDEDVINELRGAEEAEKAEGQARGRGGRGRGRGRGGGRKNSAAKSEAKSGGKPKGTKEAAASKAKGKGKGNTTATPESSSSSSSSSSSD